MPKSATDATRFTSTTPQASAKSLPSTHPQKTTTKPGPPGETTAQKIRRLKDARDSARNAQVPVIDRMLVKGRVVADWAHKITAMTLITATCTSFRIPFFVHSFIILSIVESNLTGMN